MEWQEGNEHGSGIPEAGGVIVSGYSRKLAYKLGKIGLDKAR